MSTAYDEEPSGIDRHVDAASAPATWKTEVRANANAELSERQLAEMWQAVRSLTARGRFSFDVTLAMLDVSVELLEERHATGGALSADQARFLVESGAFEADELNATEARVAAGELASLERRTRLGEISASLSAAEVAERLGIDASSVRHRQAKGLLYSFLVGGKRRYPSWQFTGEAAMPVVPGLASVIKVFPGDMRPATVRGFMETPQPTLRVEGEPTAPTGWLLSSGDPAAVVEALAGFLEQ
ncbi:hypothetical protein ACFSWE_03300 [Leucobacter albus]|uniref:Uncharacterized protein n=1 Tax=Leucobacter albus TaxID=272210 RepID=A0ABW3TP00_9MICO